jgi:predicted transcriptional regulator
MDKMNTRDVIEQFVTSESRIQIMNALREEPASQNELAERYSMSEATVSRRCDDLADRGWVQNRGGRYGLTGAGAIVLRTYEDCAETIGRSDHNDLEYLVGAESRVRFLRTLRDDPTEETGLHQDLSNSTIQRHKKGLAERNLISWRGSECRLTGSGVQALNSYNHFHGTIEQVEDKKSFLRNIGTECATLPADALGEAEVIHKTRSHPTRIADDFRERVREGFDRAWTLSSRYTEADVAALHQAIDEGAEISVVSPLPSHDIIPTDSTELRHMRRGIKLNAIDWRIHPNELPINMAIFDGKEVMLAITKQPQERESVQAMIKSDNQRLVTWSINFFETYYGGAEPPLTYLYTRLRDAGVDEVLSHIDSLPRSVRSAG